MDMIAGDEQCVGGKDGKLNLTKLQTSQELDRGSTSHQHSHQPVIVTNSNSNAGQSHLEPESRYRPQKFCAVCGDKAIACNFNAVTCESCKAFFRRNAFKETRLKCLFDNRCIIDRVTRRFCSKCRLLKCFHIGMKREWILTEEQKQVKRVKIMQNKRSKEQQKQQVLSISKSPSLTSCDETSSTSSQQRQHQHHHQQQHQHQHHQQQHHQVIVTKGTTKSGANIARHEQLADLRSDGVGVGDEHGGAYIVQQAPTPTIKVRGLPSTGKVETRDATTSCDDPFESNSQLLNGCPFVSQCGFCSLKMSGALPRNIELQLQSQQQQQPRPQPPTHPPTTTSADQCNPDFDNTNHQYQQPVAGSSVLNYEHLVTVYGSSTQQQQQQQQQPQQHLHTYSSCPPTPKHVIRPNPGSNNSPLQNTAPSTSSSSASSFVLTQTGCCCIGSKSGLENQNLNSGLSNNNKGQNYLAWDESIHLESNQCRNY